MDTCDLCGSTYLVEPVHPTAAFRRVRKLCYSHGVNTESIRMKHAYDAYHYGKKDWHKRLVANVRKELKKYYRNNRRCAVKEV